jgi:hypothetical protein
MNEVLEGLRAALGVQDLGLAFLALMFLGLGMIIGSTGRKR